MLAWFFGCVDEARRVETGCEVGRANGVSVSVHDDLG